MTDVYKFTAENRPTGSGLANTLPGVAGTLVPLIGRWLTGTLSWGCAGLQWLNRVQ